MSCFDLGMLAAAPEFRQRKMVIGFSARASPDFYRDGSAS